MPHLRLLRCRQRALCPLQLRLVLGGLQARRSYLWDNTTVHLGIRKPLWGLQILGTVPHCTQNCGDTTPWQPPGPALLPPA